MRHRFILTWSVGLLATGAFAGTPKTNAAPPQSPPVQFDRLPETCTDQCELLTQMCAQPCTTPRAKHAKAECTADCKEMASACNGSCREKGRIDLPYMQKRLGLPKSSGATEEP